MKSPIQRKTALLLATALEQLPKRLTCPKCKRSRSKDVFGLRVMARDAKGVPTRIARQSYCRDCRGRTDAVG